MMNLRFKDTHGDTQEVKIPDTLSLAVLGGVIGGLGGLIVGGVIGVVTDIISVSNGWY